MPHKTTIHSWEEWKHKCALALCSEPTRAELAGFVGPILRSKIRAWDPNASLSPGRSEGDTEADFFHLFESYMHTTSSATGKRWKDWLFAGTARGKDSNETAIERMVCSCLSTIAEDVYLKEGPGKLKRAGGTTVSFDEPAIEDGDPIGQLLADPAAPDPSQEAEIAELREIAREEAARVFPGLEWPLRIVLLAQAMDRKLNEPIFAELAGRSQSTLYQLFKDFPIKLEAELAERFSSQDTRTLRLLAIFTIQELGREILSWARSEKSCAPLFISEGEFPKP